MKSRVPRRWIVAMAAVLLLVWLAPMAMAGGGGHGYGKEGHVGETQETWIQKTGTANSNYVWIALLGLGGAMLVGYVAAKNFKGEVPASNDHGHGAAAHDEH